MVTKKNFNITSSLTYFEIQEHYQNEYIFNGVYSRDNLSNKMKDGAYVINFDEHTDIGTQWIFLEYKHMIQ